MVVQDQVDLQVLKEHPDQVDLVVVQDLQVLKEHQDLVAWEHQGLQVSKEHQDLVV